MCRSREAQLRDAFRRALTRVWVGQSGVTCWVRQRAGRQVFKCRQRLITEHLSRWLSKRSEYIIIADADIALTTALLNMRASAHPAVKDIITELCARHLRNTGQRRVVGLPRRAFFGHSRIEPGEVVGREGRSTHLFFERLARLGCARCGRSRAAEYTCDFLRRNCLLGSGAFPALWLGLDGAPPPCECRADARRQRTLCRCLSRFWRRLRLILAASRVGGARRLGVSRRVSRLVGSVSRRVSRPCRVFALFIFCAVIAFRVNAHVPGLTRCAVALDLVRDAAAGRQDNNAARPWVLEHAGHRVKRRHGHLWFFLGCTCFPRYGHTLRRRACCARRRAGRHPRGACRVFWGRGTGAGLRPWIIRNNCRRDDRTSADRLDRLYRRGGRVVPRTRPWIH